MLKRGNLLGGAMFAADLKTQLSELLPSPNDKFAIAFSGGGDSTALVHLLKDHPQCGPVYIVDHDLRAGSTEEAFAAKKFAVSCGYETHILTWKHKSPKTALQEKARRARYGLMGDACRAAGIRYLLTAHNRDDQAETLMMRYDNNTQWRGAAGMASMSYGAVWPELAQVSIYRPLLDISRQSLRDYNRLHNIKWIEDPSNENRDYARIRARDYLATRDIQKSNFIATAKDMRQGLISEQKRLSTQFKEVQLGHGGDITFSNLPSSELLALSMRSVGGGGQTVDRQRLALRYNKLKTGDIRAFTFMGAKATMEEGRLILSRDLVAVTGRRNQNITPRATELKLTASPQIWDGRFMVSAQEEGHKIRANYGLKLMRSNALKKQLAASHASVRPTLPVIAHKNTAYTLNELDGVDAKCLIGPRLEAALC